MIEEEQLETKIKYLAAIYAAEAIQYLACKSFNHIICDDIEFKAMKSAKNMAIAAVGDGGPRRHDNDYWYINNYEAAYNAAETAARDIYKAATENDKEKNNG